MTIILVKPWIKQNQDYPALSEGNVHCRRYPSTESFLALMIAEEFILAFLLPSTSADFLELALAITICYTLHLLGHISQL